jgi:hypothetical protein
MEFTTMRYVAVLLICGVVTTAYADKAVTYGSGAQSCGKWLAAIDNDEDRVIRASWVLGWISAAGHYDVHGTLRHTDVDAMKAWVDNYCHDHPLDDLDDAAIALVKALAKQGKTGAVAPKDPN